MKELLLLWVEPVYWRTAVVLAAVGLVAIGYHGRAVALWMFRRVRP